jgi:hypothetical protein
MTQITKIQTNPHVEAAAIEMLAVNLKHGDATDEYGEEAGQVITRCHSRMGLPDSAKQLARHGVVMDAILERAVKMERALIRARLVSKHN